MIVVSNSSPLITLARISRLDLLRHGIRIDRQILDQSLAARGLAPL